MNQKTPASITTLTKRITPMAAVRVSPKVSVNVESACETPALRSLLVIASLCCSPEFMIARQGSVWIVSVLGIRRQCSFALNSSRHPQQLPGQSPYRFHGPGLDQLHVGGAALGADFQG